MSARSWFGSVELAGLPGLPGTERGIRKKADTENWQWRKREGRGGGREYALASLPADAREALLASMVKNTSPTALDNPLVQQVAGKSAPTPASLFIPQSAQLKDWQRNTAEARSAFVAEVKRLAEHGGTERAIMTLVNMAAEGTLPEHFARLVPVANARSGKDGKRTLSRRSLYRWIGEAEQGFSALAPKQREKIEVPAWAPYLLSLVQRPSKPSLAWAMEMLPAQLPENIKAPSYSAARRFLDKMSAVEREKGRMGSRELKNIRPFVRRDTSQMWPGDAYTADGHTFDAEVAHPAHGKAFRPELTSVLDISTRKVVGWSAGLAESTWAVLDALRDAVLSNGIPAIFYVDNGSGYKNAMMGNEAMGFMARLSTTITHSLPYNSQARGLEERSHQSIWVRGAKELPTYMGADMDREAKQKVFKLTRADLKATGRSKLLIGWAEFVKWAQQKVDEYNNRPHRALPKIRDTETGNLRNQTPNEAWQAALNEDWQPVMVEAAEADDLFRPYKEAKVLRGEVKLFGNQYFHRDLEHYHGDVVRVGYDIHDASRVWVRDQQGRLICVAEFEANKRSYFPQSFIDQAAQKRAEGRIKRAQVRIDEAEAELQPSLMIEYQKEERFEIPSMEIPAAGDLIEAENVVRLPEPELARPIFETDAAKYRWLLRNSAEVSSEDNGWMGWYRTTSEWEDLFGEEVAAR